MTLTVCLVVYPDDEGTARSFGAIRNRHSRLVTASNRLPQPRPLSAGLEALASGPVLNARFTKERHKGHDAFLLPSGSKPRIVFRENNSPTASSVHPLRTN